jgi:hypothetical protein
MVILHYSEVTATKHICCRAMDFCALEDKVVCNLRQERFCADCKIITWLQCKIRVYIQPTLQFHFMDNKLFYRWYKFDTERENE